MINKSKSFLFAVKGLSAETCVGAFFWTPTNTACVRVYQQELCPGETGLVGAAEMCVKRSFGMAGEWQAASQNRTCKHACNTVCVCLSFTCTSLHNRKIRRTCVYLCGSTQWSLCIRVCVCVCASIPGHSETYALVLLNPAVTCSLFPAAVHHRPRPGYVTVINTDTQVWTATHTHIHGTYGSLHLT